MFEEDRLILANVLSQIYLKSSGSLSLDAEFNYILRATSGLQKNIPPIKVFARLTGLLSVNNSFISPSFVTSTIFTSTVFISTESQ